MPLVAAAQYHERFHGTVVAQAGSTSMNPPLPLAQQDAGVMSLDTHELSKKSGGIAVLALIVIIVILAVQGKKPK